MNDSFSPINSSNPPTQRQQTIRDTVPMIAGDIRGHPVPDISASPTVWQAWCAHLQTDWREYRMRQEEQLRAAKPRLIQDSINLRNLRFATSTRSTIRTILELSSARIVLDHVVIEDAQGNPFVTAVPDEVMSETLKYFRD
ncbi:hypothetical protein BGZ94_004217, partial [Podila epigama]